MVILFRMLLALVVGLGILGLAMYCRPDIYPGRDKLTNVVIVVGFIILCILGWFGIF